MKITSLWFALGGLWLLGACGFEPVYGQHEAEKFAGALPGIRVEAPRGRNEQILKTALENRLNPADGDSPAYPDYRLSVTVAALAVPVVIEGNATVQRYNMQVDSNFTLTRLADNKKVLDGHVRRLGSYNASRDFFADYTASQDSAQRAIEELAADIDLRVHAFLLAPPPPKKP